MTVEPARDAILARLRASLADAPVVPDVPRGYRAGLPEGGDVVGLFAERVADYRAEVVVVPGDGVASAVRASVGGVGPRFGAPAGFPGAGLPAAGLDRIVDEPPLSSAELDAVDGVLTG